MRLYSCQSSLPRVLVINPNSIAGFTATMQENVTSDTLALDFYTAPDTVPAGLNGSEDCVVSATDVLRELKPELHRWQAFVVACFSAHPLVPVLREITDRPVISILEAPLLFGASLGAKVGILTTSNRWEKILERDVRSVGLEALNRGGITSSGYTPAQLHDIPSEIVRKRLGEVAKKFVEDQGADVIVLGCAGMAGFEEAVKATCDVVVLDPVKCAVQLAAGLVAMGLKTSKTGLYGA